MSVQSGKFVKTTSGNSTGATLTKLQQDRGRVVVSQDKGRVPGDNSNDDSGNNSDYTSPVYYGGYGGYGGYASGEEPEDMTPYQITNLGDVTQKRAGDMNQIAGDSWDQFQKITGDRLKGMDKAYTTRFKNLDQAGDANDATLRTAEANIQRGINWQANQQKEQSALMAQRNRMGNAAYGSGIQDLAEGMQRYDDMMDVELIDAYNQNENAAYASWAQTANELVNAHNELSAAMYDDYNQFASDVADSERKFREEYADQMSQLEAGYATGMSNINPKLASQENIAQAAKYARKQENLGKAIDKLVKTNTGTGEISTKGLSKTQKQAVKYLNQAIKEQADQAALQPGDTKGSKGSNAIKSAAKRAKELIKEAYSKKTVSVDVDGETYTLPNIDLSGRVNLESTANLQPNKWLQAHAKRQANVDTRNPRTSSYVRPDRATALGGTINTSRAANSGFSDNLAAFRRV